MAVSCARTGGPTPSVVAFGGAACGRWLGLDEVMRAPHHVGALIGGDTSEQALAPSWGADRSGRTGGRLPPREEAQHEPPRSTLTLDLRPPGL